MITTANGTEAVEMGVRADQPIDLLISDVVMPGLSGPEAAEKLRQAHPRMRTLFLSGYARHAALSDRLTAAPGAFLQKPFSASAAASAERLART